MNNLQRISLTCVFMLAVTENAIADSLKDDAHRAFIEAFMAGNYEEATKIYRPRAALGDADAQRWLGYIYSVGKGVPQDYKEAVKWYRRAAEQGDTDAQMSLGLMYADGMGVSQDYILAHMWLNISAANEKDSSEAANMRNELAKEMTSAQIEKAHALARKCIAKKLKGC